jgi:hypothetical protein
VRSNRCAAAAAALANYGTFASPKTAIGRQAEEGIAMCFSAEASFGASAVLVPVGIYCVSRAAGRDWRFLPLGLMPVAFGVQQAAEGCVWLGLRQDQQVPGTPAAALFLFFALVFWPFWVPFSLLLPESRRPAKVFLGGVAILSLVWLWLYSPLAVDPGRWLSVQVVHHSIHYETSSLPAFRLAPRAAWRVAYLAFICVPLIIARPGSAGNGLRLGAGILVAALFAVSYLVYWYAFTSVWCFFAALLSLLLGLAFTQLPRRAGRPVGPNQRAPAADPCVS